MKGFALCVAATLATLAIGSPDITAGGNLRALDDGISADITILAATGIVFGTPTFFYGGSGCGRGNKKCWCTLENNSIQMYGVGSSLTTTGLTFACGFLVNEFTFCELNLNMFWQSTSGQRQSDVEDSPTSSRTLQGGPLEAREKLNYVSWSCAGLRPDQFSDFTMVGVVDSQASQIVQSVVIHGKSMS